MKQFFTDVMCGYFSGSSTEMFNSLMFRNWSTDCNVPSMLRVPYVRACVCVACVAEITAIHHKMLTCVGLAWGS
jgi:hypothetical protein